MPNTSAEVARATRTENTQLHKAPMGSGYRGRLACFDAAPFSLSPLVSDKLHRHQAHAQLISNNDAHH